MSPASNGELPEEFRNTDSDQVTREPQHAEPQVRNEETPVQVETVSNGWLLLGIFLLVTIGVLMLLIFASGGNAESSTML